MQGDTFGLVGTVIEGRYRVDAPVGEGGFGVVYRGQHLSLGHPIAIKCLKTPPHFNPTARDAFIAKFREEGQLLSRLRDCPAVVHVDDFGVTTASGGHQVPFLVLEWLEGQTIEQLLKQRRAQGAPPMGLAEAVALLMPAFDALAFAHRMKIAHRDIKPANLFVAQTARGVQLKVLDFGIAKVMQEGDSAQQAATGTGSGFQAFSPGYGAPEQFFSRRYGASGPWTDVHALALTLVEMMTGQTALRGEDMAELLMNATADERPTPRSRGLVVPDPVEAVFWRALALTTAQRFVDAEQFYEALRGALHASGQPVPPALPSLGSPYGAAPPPAGPGASFGHYGPPPAQAPAPAPQAATAGWTGGGTQAPPTAPAPPGFAPPPSPGFSPPPGSSPYGPGTSPPAGSPYGPGTAPPAMYGNYGQTGAPPGQYGPGPSPYGGHTPPGVASTGPGYPGSVTAPASRQPSGTEVGPPVAPRPAGGPPSRTPWIVAGVVGLGVVGLGAVGVALMVGGVVALGSSVASSSAGGVGSAAPVHPDGVAFALALAHDRDLSAIVPQARAPEGKWHWRLHRQGGRLVKAEQVRPNGVLAQVEQYEYPADGGRVEHLLDGHGTEQQTTTVTAKGVVTTVLRSGVTTYRGCNRIERTFDAAGNVTETRCLALTGLGVIDESGCQALRATYNEHHQEISTGCFSLEGAAPRPVANRDGVHLSRAQYDGSNNQTNVRYFDETGAPTADQSTGCFGHAYRYDAASNPVADTCLDANGSPRAQLGSAVATSQYEVNPAGCVVGLRYLDVGGSPAAMGETASIGLTMSPLCDMLGREQRKRDGSLTGKPSGVASWAYRYDVHGDTLSMACFDEARRPVSCQNGTGPIGAIIRYEQDPRGRVSRQQGFKGDGTPSAQSNSYPHETRSAYGDDGQLATRTFHDEQGRPVTALGQTARMSYRYDALGGVVSEAFFGVDQGPIEASIGCHEMRTGYDASHRIARIECLDTGGQPRATRGLINHDVTWPAGAARVDIDRTGPAVVNAYSGPGGQPVKRVECKKAEQLCYR